MARRETEGWDLEQFLDSLILELDKAQDTLALKGLTRKLTYTVKDVGLDLNIFPSMEAGKVKFRMAQPGDQGGSRISFQLGSITDRQIRENANEPPSKDDLTLDVLEGVDDQVKESLKKVGVHSTRDLEKLDRRNVNLEKVVRDKTGQSSNIDYSDLANLINKARRRNRSPALSQMQARARPEADTVEITLKGSNFILKPMAQFPAAMLNAEPAEIVHADEGRLQIKVPRSSLHPGSNQLAIALDPYAVMKVDVQS